jgi:signal transduction histidine kinase
MLPSEVGANVLAVARGDQPRPRLRRCYPAGVADRRELAAIAKLISEAADRGSELTSRLLAFSRKQPLQPRDTNIHDLMVESARLLRPALGANIEIAMRLEDTSSALVDPTQLSTAIVNLGINARDAMPSGGKLTLEARNVTINKRPIQQRSTLWTSVSDTIERSEPFGKYCLNRPLVCSFMLHCCTSDLKRRDVCHH